MIQLDNLSYSFPMKELYHNISFTLEAGQHCAFIGTSGSGKSTLINIIMNPENYMYSGKLTIEPEIRIGYVSQFSQSIKIKGMTVFEYIAEDFISLQKELDAICVEMETSEEIETLLETYQLALDAFSALGGDNYESTIYKKLNLVHLLNHKDLPVTDLSGGEFKLVQVIKEMLQNPELMIMDEPDVFLDFEHLSSLRNLINSHKGILLVITHNRYLLNHCFNKIIHLENKEIQEFDGNYIDYNFTLLQKKIELQELAIADTLEIERYDVLIDKLRTVATNNAEASRGRSLKARVKYQERLEARRIKEPFVDIKQPDILLMTNHPIKDTTALKITNYSVSFDEVLLENVNFEIGSKDKVALIGPNGSGKTTLMRAIYNNALTSIERHPDIEMAYLSQLQGEMLNESNTILEEFMNTGFATYDAAKEHLQRYGFNEDIVNQPISALSGGEKNILQLAKVSTTKANMLLLDEPTSHLDTYSQIALEKAIAGYNGSVLMISHDFYSVIHCVDYVLLVEDKTIRKMNLRKFRKMIYEHHFAFNYLDLEQKKKECETKIELALKNKDFESAKLFAEELGEIIVEITGKPIVQPITS